MVTGGGGGRNNSITDNFINYPLDPHSVKC